MTVHCAVCGKPCESQRAVRYHAGHTHGPTHGRTGRERAAERRVTGEDGDDS